MFWSWDAPPITSVNQASYSTGSLYHVEYMEASYSTGSLYHVEYIPRNMHMVCAVLCFVTGIVPTVKPLV